MTGREQVQEILVKVKEPGGVRERLAAREGQDLCNPQKHCISHADLDLIAWQVIRVTSFDMVIQFIMRQEDGHLRPGTLTAADSKRAAALLDQ